jgi:hypothetical protein
MTVRESDGVASIFIPREERDEGSAVPFVFCLSFYVVMPSEAFFADKGPAVRF